MPYIYLRSGDIYYIYISICVCVYVCVCVCVSVCVLDRKSTILVYFNKKQAATNNKNTMALQGIIYT